MPRKIQGQGNWLDRVVGFVAPRAGLRRIRARVATELLARHYESASTGRRTQGWKRNASDANAAAGPALARLREVARDLVRNNGHAESALNTIGDHVVGWGIAAKPKKPAPRALAAWKTWTETAACDADGRNDFAGLQKLVMRTVVESGECLVRRRLRFPTDDLPLPLQLQVLEPDYIDTAKTDIRLPNGGRIIQGVEFDVLGKRAAYWLFREHPGSALPGPFESVRIPADGILHVYKQSRPGQVRGPSWFAPVILKFKDYDDYDDATLMKQKIAACLAVITSDVDGTAPPLGIADDSSPEVDSLEPGMILNVPPGRTITVVDPPTVREYNDYSQATLRAIATGLGVNYEDITGDYGGMPFSAARMSRIRHWARVDDWRWRTLIPQFCDPVWRWAMQAAQILSLTSSIPEAEWTAPPPPMVDPANEGLAYQRNIRTGIMSLSEALRERGYDPRAVLEEIAADNKLLDELGIVLDSDPRKTTQAGNPSTAAASPAPQDAPPPADAAAAPADAPASGGQ